MQNRSNFDRLRISIGLGLLACFVLRIPFYNILLGPAGILSTSQVGSWKYFLTGLPMALVILFVPHFLSLVFLVFGIQKRIFGWIVFLNLIFLVHLFTSTNFPAYMTLTAEKYFVWPFLLLASQQSQVFKTEKWPWRMLIIYVVYLYLYPLVVRSIYPEGWLDGQIIQITLNELNPQISEWRQFFLENPRLMQILSWSALVVESSAVLLLWKTWRKRVAWTLMLFHILIATTTFVVFQSILMVALLFPIAFENSENKVEC